MLIANLPVYSQFCSGGHMSAYIRKAFRTLRHCECTLLILTLNLEVVIAFLLSSLVGIQWYISI